MAAPKNQIDEYAQAEWKRFLEKKEIIDKVAIFDNLGGRESFMAGFYAGLEYTGKLIRSVADWPTNKGQLGQ